MKKIVFALTLCLTLMLCACGESSSVVTVDDELGNATPGTLQVYSTRNDADYIDFLIDYYDRIEIIDITTGMSTYGKGESYVITYKVKSDYDTSAVSYKYYLFKTRNQDEYIEFYNELDLNESEIIDISTRLSTYGKGESYVITYRERA